MGQEELDDRGVLNRLGSTEEQQPLQSHSRSDSTSAPIEETSSLLNPALDSYHHLRPPTSNPTTTTTTTNITNTSTDNINADFIRYPPPCSDYINSEHLTLSSSPPQLIQRNYNNNPDYNNQPNGDHQSLNHLQAPSYLQQSNPYQDVLTIDRHQPDQQADIIIQTLDSPSHTTHHHLPNPHSILSSPPSPPHHPLSFISTTPSTRPSYHSRAQNSFDNLLPHSSSPSPYPYNPHSGSPQTLPRRLLPLLPTHSSSSPSQSPLTSPTVIETPNMPTQFHHHPGSSQHPDNLSSLNILSQYSPPLPPPQHHVPYLFAQPNSALNSVDEFKSSPNQEFKSPYAAQIPKNPGYHPKEFETPNDLAEQKVRAGKSSDPRRARRRKFLMIGYRRLAIITIAGLLLILAAVGVIIFTHLKRSAHTPDVTGDSDGDVVGQSGLGSARNASASTGIDPFNATNSAFGPDNGLRGGINGYDSLVVFGASYCDNAHARPSNLRHSLKPSPYYKGRWTNGYVWNEYLSAIIGPGGRPTTLVNYAFGGATVDNGLNEAPVPDLDQQVSAFLSDLSAQSAGAGPSNGKSLVAIWVGINSITKIWNLVLKQEVQAHSQLDVQDITAKAQLNINATVDHIFEVVTNLIHTTAFKAAVPDLMLLPIPPAQLLLVNLRAAKGNLGALRTLAALNDLFNARFADRLISFQDSLAPEQRVFTLDIPTIWHKFIEDPASAKLTVVDQPCLTKSGVCNSPDSYLFWDTLHPTTHVHEQLALMMASEIKR
ncbi:hypothetical protein PGT21_023028 [Puccinia graminis f. sp. tritici]|uniref:Carbohydrate esterase family 16 protein n=1 Tax=Puccinia graminis f. sp. tritici TaxID=56615 RepID=A0A5B0QFZ0_PUCGR|nr:hypothetical protein PGT21_023028 [Puccinia graminis f. sp. tritici]